MVNEIHHGYSPLWMAVSYGHKDVMKILFEAKADITFQYNNRSCLYEGIRKNDMEVVRVLLQNGANPNFNYLNQTWALHEAIRKKNVEIVKLLLKAGALMLVLDEEENTPVHVAAATGNEEMLRL